MNDSAGKYSRADTAWTNDRSRRQMTTIETTSGTQKQATPLLAESFCRKRVPRLTSS